MSPLTDLASLPCIGSPKLAQTIIDEMRGRGWRFTPIARPTMIADPGAIGVDNMSHAIGHRSVAHNPIVDRHEWEWPTIDP